MARRDQVRHPRSPAARWVRRMLGVAGTAVVLGLGVVIATMVLPGDDGEAVAPGPATTASPQPTPAEQRKPRLTARQRAERRRAVDQVRRQGYTPVELAAYRVDHELRVLIGRPVGTTPPGLRAFFFAGDEYIGQDALAPSLELRPGRQREREVTLVYSLYELGDRECCPKGGDVRVRFAGPAKRWSRATRSRPTSPACRRSSRSPALRGLSTKSRTPDTARGHFVSRHPNPRKYGCIPFGSVRRLTRFAIGPDARSCSRTGP